MLRIMLRISVQEMNEKMFITFNDLGREFLKLITNLARIHCATRITVVFDTYRKDSLKAAERIRRGDTVASTYVVSGERKIQSYRQFLKSHENKQQLLFFLSEFCEVHAAKYLKEDQHLIIAGGFKNAEKVVAIHGPNVSEPLVDLYSTHEEADTRMILHAIYEAKVRYLKVAFSVKLHEGSTFF